MKATYLESVAGKGGMPREAPVGLHAIALAAVVRSNSQVPVAVLPAEVEEVHLQTVPH